MIRDKFSKRITLFVLTAIFMFGFAVTTFAEENAGTEFSGTVSSSRNNSPSGEQNVNAFDGDDDTKWLEFFPSDSYSTWKSQNGSWLKFELTDPYLLTPRQVIVTRYTITSGNDHNERDPRSWTLQGSRDGTDASWVDLDSRSDITWGSRKSDKTYSIAAEKQASYTFYRLNIRDVRNSSATCIQLSELKLLFNENSDPSAPTVHLGAYTPSSWSKDNVVVSFDGSTDLIVKYQYMLNNNNNGWPRNWTDGSATTLTTDGTTILRARSYDAYDNTSGNSEVTVKIDKTAPTIPTINLGTYVAGSTSSVPVTATFASTDTASGIARYEYSLDNGANWLIATGNTVVVSDEGTTQLKARAVDNAGNVSAASAGKTIIIYVIDGSITISTNTLTESDANLGAVEGSRSVVLSGKTFAASSDGTGNLKKDVQYRITGTVPAGLTLQVVRASDTRLQILYTGAASDHSLRTVNVQVDLLDAAFSGTTAAKILGSQDIPCDITFISKAKIKVLEVYPSELKSGEGVIRDASGLSASDYEVTSINMNRFISEVDELNGRYDVIYFSQGRYLRNSPTDNSYGNDITDKRALRLKSFINGKQLFVYHANANAVNKGETSLNGQALSTMPNSQLSTNMMQLIGEVSGTNVVSLTGTGSKTTALATAITSYYGNTANNHRPLLTVMRAPYSYRANDEPFDNDTLVFTYRADDPDAAYGRDTQLTAKLFIDRNNDGLFNETTEVVDRHLVNVTENDTFVYQMPSGMTGIFYWKLVLSDTVGARDEFKDVYRLKGDPITINVLQVGAFATSDGNYSSNSLIDMFNSNVAGETFKYKELPGEYKLNITYAYADDFYNVATHPEYANLNGKYQMLVFGFGDNYNTRDFPDSKITEITNRINAFINTKQSVMFTHDTIGYENFSGYTTNGVNPNIRASFRSTVGQTNILDSVIRNNNLSPSANSDPKYVTAFKLGDYSPLWGGHDTNKVRIINETAMTMYPFDLSKTAQSSMTVANTHNQYYKLNLENEDLIPVFNYYRGDMDLADDRALDDSMSSYYTYQLNNITYSGTGHSNGYSDFEKRFFVNTIMKAYASANHAPKLEVTSPQDNAKLDLRNPAFNLKFHAYDFDLSDTRLSYRIAIDPTNTGTNYTYVVGTTTGVAIDNNSLVSVDVTKGFSDARNFLVKVELMDLQGAAAAPVILHLRNVADPLITVNTRITDAAGNNTNTFLVGDTLNYYVGLAASGRHNPSIAVSADVKTLVPSELMYGVSAGPVTYSAITGAINFTPSAEPVEQPVLPAAIMIVTKASVQASLPIQTTAYYTIDGTTLMAKGDAPFQAKNSDVRVYVKDENNKPIPDCDILMDGISTGFTTDIAYGIAAKNGNVSINNIRTGSHSFSITAPGGYDVVGTAISEVVGGIVQPPTVTTNAAATVNMSYAHNAYQITIQLKFKYSSVPVSYFYITPGNKLQYLGKDDGVDPAPMEISVKKNSKVRFVAMLDIGRITNNKVVEMDLGLSINNILTSTEGRIVPLTTSVALGSVLSPVSVEQTAMNAVRADASRRLGTVNTNAAGFPTADEHNYYYTIFEIDSASNQTVRISDLTLKFLNTSSKTLPLKDMKILSIKPLIAPTLK